MKRGEIYYANLNPSVGSEMSKNRPVLIVSNDINNRAASTITILPITSNVSRVYPFEVFLSRLMQISLIASILFRQVLCRC